MAKKNNPARPLAPKPLATEVQAAVAASPLVPVYPAGMHRWTFLTNHAHVLILLSRDPTMVLRQVAFQIGITERAVQRIIADLEEDGFIERQKVGRNNHYRILDHQPLRHPIESHRTIGDLIKLVSR